jgi:phage terminase large subunit-like protein
VKTVALDLDNGLRMKLRNSPNSLTPSEKEKARAEILAAIKRVDDIDQELKTNNPFWYYQPVTGEISTERREFLHKHLKHDDVPQNLQGPLHMHLSEKPIRVASGGNQSSKSHGMVMELIMMATGKIPFCFDPNSRWFKWKLPAKRYEHEKPKNVRVVGFDWENDVVKNLLPKFRDLSPRECLTNGSFDKSYVAGESTLHYSEKGKVLGSVEFMSNKQDLASFGGPPRDAVGFDEEPFHEVYKENLMRMTTAKNFEVLMASTPVNGISWAYDELYSKWLAGDANIDYFQYCSVANPYSNLDSLVQILNGLSYEEKKMRLLGEFISLSGLVYGRLFDKSVHVIEPFQTGCTCDQTTHDQNCPYTNFLGFLGIDPHMVKDSTAALCFIDREDNFYVDTCYKGADNIDQFRDNIRNLLVGKRMAWSVFDPSSDSTITAFNGLNIFKLCTKNPNPFPRARKGEKYHGSIAAGVQTIKQRLELNPTSKKPKFFIMNRPENQLLIKSMKTLQRDAYANEDVRGQKDKIQEGVHDHHACVRYIMQNKLNWRSHVEYSPTFMIPDEEAMLL